MYAVHVVVRWVSVSFFFNDTATTEIYTLSLHDALPIWPVRTRCATTRRAGCGSSCGRPSSTRPPPRTPTATRSGSRSEEHTSELQSRQYLVCRLLLEKKQRMTLGPLFDETGSADLLVVR